MSVYFIEAGKGGAIKIGYAVDVAARMRTLQCASAKTLTLIVATPGERKDETRLHRRFKHERTTGEWFKSNGTVRAFALSLTEMTPEQVAVAIAFEEPSRAKRAKKKRGGDPFRGYSREQLVAMFNVGDGSTGIYRSTEAEALLAERERRFKNWR